MKVVKVVFNQGFNPHEPNHSKKEYSYFVDFEVQKGDCVIVFAMNEYKATTVVQVAGLSKSELETASKLAVCKMDPIDYAKRVEKLEVIMEIKNELRCIKEQQDELEVYRVLAKNNPKVAELMDKLADMDETIAPLIEQK